MRRHLFISALLVLALTGCAGLGETQDTPSAAMTMSLSKLEIQNEASVSSVTIDQYVERFNSYIETSLGFPKYRISQRQISHWQDKQALQARFNNTMDLKVQLSEDGRVVASSLVGVDLITTDQLDDRPILQAAIVYALNLDIEKTFGGLRKTMTLDESGVSNAESVQNVMSVHEAIMPSDILDGLNTYFVVLPQREKISSGHS